MNTRRWFLLGVAMAVPVLACSNEDCQEGEARCENNAAYTCVFTESPGYSWQIRPCDTACVTARNEQGGTEAFCALASTPDPRCVDGNRATCGDGDVLLTCREGYATAAQPCGTTCVALDDHEDYCQGASTESHQCTISGSGCEEAGPKLNSVEGSVAPTCEEGTAFSALFPEDNVYAFACDGGVLVTRTRCASRCVIHSDCSSSCD